MTSLNAFLAPFAFLICMLCACGGPDAPVPPLPSTPEPHEFVSGQAFSGDNAWLHAKFLCDLGPRPSQSDALAKSREYISSQLQKYGWTVNEERFTTKTPLGKREFVNLIGRFQPEQSAAVPRGLLCGHIDTKRYSNSRFIGANDGASHTGLMLEIARILALQPLKARQIDLVFFDGEEAFEENIVPGQDGLYGSLYHAKRYRGKASSAKPRWGIVVDMVGHRRLRLEVPADTPAALYQVYREVSRKLPQGTRRFGASNATIIDDHLPLNRAGIPTIDLIGEFRSGDWWHTEKDTLDILSPGSLELSGQLVEGMVYQLLTQS